MSHTATSRSLWSGALSEKGVHTPTSEDLPINRQIIERVENLHYLGLAHNEKLASDIRLHLGGHSRTLAQATASGLLDRGPRVVPGSAQ